MEEEGLTTTEQSMPIESSRTRIINNMSVDVEEYNDTNIENLGADQVQDLVRESQNMSRQQAAALLMAHEDVNGVT